MCSKLTLHFLLYQPCLLTTTSADKSKPLKMLKNNIIQLFKGAYFIEWKIFMLLHVYLIKAPFFEKMHSPGANIIEVMVGVRF